MSRSCTLYFSLLIGLAWQGVSAAQAPVTPGPPETATHDEPVTFRTRVNLVMVPVVVRDRQGRAVGGLHQEDFELFDRGKPQIITKFSIERSGGKVSHVVETGGAANTEGQTQREIPPGTPDHFVAYLFDDVHLSFGDLVHARDAAGRNLDTLGTTDRAAIFTTSGQTTLEFTDDRAKLHETLNQLRIRPIGGHNAMECPEISYYMADQIENKNDPQAWQALLSEAAGCGMAGSQDQLRAMVRSVLAVGGQETRISFSVLKELVRRMAAAPGQRTIVLASPGFIYPQQQTDLTEIIDQAIHANVIISAVDVRGLWTDPGLDAGSRGPQSAQTAGILLAFKRREAVDQAGVLAEVAAGTGGAFVENTNDLDAGFKRVATPPEYYYVLGFSPQNLKLDGRYHALKVAVKEADGLSADARRGYYSPKQLADAMELARQELEESLYSREELNELPVTVRTQFFKSGADKGKVSVLMHVDIKRLPLRKADGRNRNDLNIIAALFDRNGSVVAGNKKLVELRLKDATIEKLAATGFTVRSTFDVKPGTYLLRLVVRDADGGAMSAANSAVDIPQ